MTETQLEFARGKEYKVELYPREDIVNAMYLGKSKGTHIFSGCAPVQGKIINGFALVDEHWMQIRGDGTVSYDSASSSVVGFASKKILRDRMQKSRNPSLVKRLREVGVEI